MKLISVIAAVSVVLFAMSCQKMAASNSSRAVIESKYFINGDPMEVVAGTKTNSMSFLTTENYKDFDGFEVSGIMSFTQRTKREDKNDNDMESVKKKNAAPTEAVEQKDTASRFQAAEDGRRFRLQVKSIPGFFLEFTKSPADHRLDLKLATFEAENKDDTESYAVKPVHFSVNPEKTAFSVIFLIPGENDSSMLMGFSYQKKTDKSFIMKAVEAAKDFFYLFGKGVLVSQSRIAPLKIQACGRNSEIFKNEITEGVKPWMDALNNRLAIQLEFVDQCLPIFDVNSQTIQFLENRITRVSEKVLNPAVVFPRAALSQGLIVGSDMLIFKGEYKRMAKIKGQTNDQDGQPFGLRDDVKTSVMHEFGHVLGLDHPFEAKVDSIMGYDGKIVDLTDYDVKAVQALYPLATIEQKANK